MDAIAQLASTRTCSESVRNSPSDPSTAQQDNTLIRTKVVLPVLALAKLALQPTNVTHAQAKDMLPTLLAFVLQSVVMDSSLDQKLAILETPSPQDARTAKFNRDILAPDSHQSAELPLLLPLLLLHQLPPQLPLPHQLPHLLLLPLLPSTNSAPPRSMLTTSL